MLLSNDREISVAFCRMGILARRQLRRAGVPILRSVATIISRTVLRPPIIASTFICTVSFVMIALAMIDTGLRAAEPPSAKTAPKKIAPARRTRTAEQMMVRAQKARAVWNEFPGFSANVILTSDGTSVKGKLTVSADGEIELKTKANVDVKWAHRRLSSVVMHRQVGSQDEYDVSFVNDITIHPLGRLIRFNDDRSHSVYRIDEDIIREVQRQMGDMRFTISVLEVNRNPEGQILPRTYTVSYWDKSNNLIRSDSFVTSWKRVDKFDLPTSLLNVSTANDGKRTVQQIRLSQLRLLSAATN